VGDSSSKTVITLGNGVKSSINNLSYMVWMVFDKDSGGYSTLNVRGKMLSLAGINLITNEIPSSYSLSQNYPNPFNSMCNVQFSMCNAGNVKFVVYDVQGREVQTLVNERLQAGTYKTTFDGSTQNSGVYFYKLTTNGFTETKRMLMIK
jgi:hypothetical protein